MLTGIVRETGRCCREAVAQVAGAQAGPTRLLAARDGLETRRLEWFEQGSLDHCTLPAGASSKPARDSTAHEIWYVPEGCGELWRAGNGEETTSLLWLGIGFDVPADTTSPIRATGVGALAAVR